MEKLDKKELSKINGGIGIKTLFGDNIRDLFNSSGKLETQVLKNYDLKG